MQEEILKWLAIGVLIGSIICVIIDFVIIFYFLILGKFMELLASFYFLILFPIAAACAWEVPKNEK